MSGRTAPLRLNHRMVYITENIVRDVVERAETAVREYEEADAAKMTLVAA